MVPRFVLILISLLPALGGCGHESRAGAPADSTIDEFRSRRNACDSVRDHALLAGWCDARGLAEQARLQWRRVLRLDADHAGAREALGHVFYKAPDDIISSIDYRGELARHHGRWRTPETLAEISRLEESLRRRIEAGHRRAEDDAWFARARIRLRAELEFLALGGYGGVVFIEPYVLASSLDTAQATLEAVAEHLHRTLDGARTVLGGSIASGDAAGLATPPPLLVTILDSRTARPPNDEQRAGFDPRGRTVTLQLDGVAGDGATAEAISAAFARQLLQGLNPRGDEVRSLWLRLGLPLAIVRADLMRRIDRHRDPGQLRGDVERDVGDVREAIGGRRHVQLFDLIGYRDVNRAARDRRLRQPGHVDEFPETLLPLLEAQAWTLAHFFLHHDGGRYKAAFQEYVRAELSGNGGRPAFNKAFGLRLRDEYAAVEKAWVAHVQALALARHGTSGAPSAGSDACR